MKPMLAMMGMLAALLPFLAATCPATAQDGGSWGTVKGRITSDKGNVDPLKLPESNPSTPDCLKANKGLLPPNETWIMNKENKGLKNVYVWLADFANPKSKEPLPTHPSLKEIKVKQLEVDQPACHFIPHCIALREGQVLVVKNSATFSHNFKYTGNPLTKNAGENFMLAPGGSKEVKLFADRFPIQSECNIHPWMKGWIRVFNHPYFAVTDDNGAFEFKDAPAGKFRLMVWHGNAGWNGGAKGKDGTPIDIKAGGVTDLAEIIFPSPKD